MQFNININQKALHDLGIKISLEAAVVMDCMHKKSSISAFQKRQFIEGNKAYFEFTHNLIVENLPIIFSDVKGSQKNKVIRLTNELESAKLIEKHPNPKSVKRSLYCFTELADKLIENTPQEAYSTIKPLSSKSNSKPKPLSSNRDSDSHQIVTVEPISLSSNRDRSIITDKEVYNQGEYTPAPENFETVQGEGKEGKEKSCAKKEKEEASAPINPKARKIYDVSHLDIYDDIVAFWQSSEGHRNAIKATIDTLGINDNTPQLKTAFFDYVKNIFCASIFKNTETAISVIDIHKSIIQKIGYSHSELKGLDSKSNGFAQKNGTIEQYSEAYLLKILTDTDKHWVKDLKQASPQELADKLKTWKERNVNDETMIGAFPQFAEKRIKAAYSLNLAK